MRALRTVALSILAPILAGIILNYVLLLPPSFIIVICMLAFLMVFICYQYCRSLRLEDGLNHVISIVKIVVDALMGARGRLF